MKMIPHYSAALSSRLVLCSLTTLLILNLGASAQVSVPPINQDREEGIRLYQQDDVQGAWLFFGLYSRPTNDQKYSDTKSSAKRPERTSH